MTALRGAVIGCGYFARNHLNGWREAAGAEIVAVCDLDSKRAEAYAREFGARAAYDDVEAMLEREKLDFVDVVTQPASHRALVEAAARRGVPVICQKPLATSIEDGRAMVEACRRTGARFMVHENFRWQRPMRALKAAAGRIGEPFFGRIQFRTGFDVASRQPYLATEPRFIILDLGVHLLDLARFFLGEVKRLHCVARRVDPRFRGEDSAAILLEMENGAACVVDMSYSTRPAEEIFPQTLVHLEGNRGSATLGPHYRITAAAEGRVETTEAAPRAFSWSVPNAVAVQESIVAIQEHWIACLREGKEPETSGADNLRTLELVFGAYESAASGGAYRAGGTAGGRA